MFVYNDGHPHPDEQIKATLNAPNSTAWDIDLKIFNEATLDQQIVTIRIQQPVENFICNEPNA